VNGRDLTPFVILKGKNLPNKNFHVELHLNVMRKGAGQKNLWSNGSEVYGTEDQVLCQSKEKCWYGMHARVM
jgi:hypothetical protein